MTDTVGQPPDNSARRFLFDLLLHGIKLDLENIRLLLDGAGRPQDTYPSLHVAGTNGKGSVVAILDSMFRAAGYRTGRFTSPHLIDLNERFLVNRRPISDADLDRLILRFHAIAETMPRPPTFFEMNTAVAFECFREAGVDIALVEVGMGGRFDATNVIAPLVSAITSIDLEHTQYLGNSLEAIAFEKAGIIKPGVPVVVGELKQGPLDVILGRAADLGSPALLAGRDYHFSLAGDPWHPLFSYTGPVLSFGPAPLALAGPYQGANAAVACAMAEQIQPVFPRLNTEAAAQGLRDARWPCRLERLIEHPAIIVDATHTPAGARQLTSMFGQCDVIFAVSSDKDARAMLDVLAPMARRLILTEFDGRRALPLEDLRTRAAGLNFETAPTLQEAIGSAVRDAEDAVPILITGSIFAAGEARRILADSFGAPLLEF